MQTQIEFSAGIFIRVALGVNTVESGGKKRDRAEGRIKLDHWLDDLLKGKSWEPRVQGCQPEVVEHRQILRGRREMSLPTV